MSKRIAVIPGQANASGPHFGHALADAASAEAPDVGREPTTLGREERQG